MTDDILWSGGPAVGVCRPPVRAPMPAHRVEADAVAVSRRLKASGLIQHVNGVELPAPGRWSITARQRLAVSTPWALRSSAVETVAGTLDVDDGRLDAILSFVARAPGRPSFHFGYSGRLIDADRCGRWSFKGSAIVDGHGIPKLQIAVTYFGVYDHGAAPVVLLQLSMHYRYPRPARRLDGPLNAQRTKVTEVEPCRDADQMISGRDATQPTFLIDMDEFLRVEFPEAGSTARKPLDV